MEIGINLSVTGKLLVSTAAFTPSDLTDLKLWLRADTNVTKAGGGAPSDGDAIERWQDQAQTKNFDQLTAAKQPTYETGEVNGQPAIRFDGTDDTLSLSEGILDSAGDDGILAVVFKLHLSHASRDVFLGSLGASSDRVDMEVFDAVIDARVRVSSTNNDRIIAGGAISKNVWHMLIWSSNGTSYPNARLDGVEKGVDVDDGIWYGDPASPTATHLGSRDGTAAFFQGDIAELIVADDPNGSKVTDLENYLNDRYAIF